MLSRALKMVRVFNGMSQADLADSIGISRSYLCEIEKGKKKPTLDLLEKYKIEFDVPISSLLLFSEKMESNSFSEKVRNFSAKKVLEFLEWIGEDAEPKIRENKQAQSKL